MKKVPKSIFICDPNIKKKFIDGYKNYNLEDTLKIRYSICAINHSIFKKKQIMKYSRKNTKIIDIWNHLKTDQFIQKNERIFTGAGGFIGRELVNQLSKNKK